MWIFLIFYYYVCLFQYPGSMVSFISIHTPARKEISKIYCVSTGQILESKKVFSSSNIQSFCPLILHHSPPRISPLPPCHLFLSFLSDFYPTHHLRARAVLYLDTVTARMSSQRLITTSGPFSWTP